MNTDCALFTGKTHPICQDYARTGWQEVQGTDEKVPFALISDGCSSSPDTDVGSRLLVFSAEKAIRIHRTYDIDFQYTVASVAQVNAEGMGLKPSCLDATLMAAFLRKNLTDSGPETQLFLRMYGDGAIALKFRGMPNLYLLTVEYAESMPWYISYLLDPPSMDLWLEATKKSNKKTVKILEIEPEGLTNEIMFEPPSSTPNPEMPLTVGMGKDNSHSILVSHLLLDWVAIMSDGIHTFWQRTDNGSKIVIPVTEVVQHMLDFKNFNGEFVKRQMNWFMKTHQKQGWQHDDDVSVAAIYFGE